jgi:phage gp46-like protein
MTDITTTWDTARGDYRVDGASLASGDDLATSVLISLFTDRTLPSDETPADGSSDPRGWWADDEIYPIGSRLWTLERAKRTQETLARARSYIEEALQWLIDDGVVSRFDLLVEWDQYQRLSAQITAHKPDNTSQNLAYAWAWDSLS